MLVQIPDGSRAAPDAQKPLERQFRRLFVVRLHRSMRRRLHLQDASLDLRRLQGLLDAAYFAAHLGHYHHLAHHHRVPHDWSRCRSPGKTVGPRGLLQFGPGGPSIAPAGFGDGVRYHRVGCCRITGGIILQRDGDARCDYISSRIIYEIIEHELFD